MMPMRRKDRQVTEKAEILQIMQNCDVVRLGIKDEDSYPYIVPLNFGMEEVEGQVVLYLHWKDINWICYERILMSVSKWTGIMCFIRIRREGTAP